MGLEIVGSGGFASKQVPPVVGAKFTGTPLVYPSQSSLSQQKLNSARQNPSQQAKQSTGEIMSERYHQPYVVHQGYVATAEPKYLPAQSHHSAHHEFQDWVEEQNRNFNYPGSRLRSPHHDPRSIANKFQHAEALDAMYNHASSTQAQQQQQQQNQRSNSSHNNHQWESSLQSATASRYLSPERQQMEQSGVNQNEDVNQFNAVQLQQRRKSLRGLSSSMSTRRGDFLKQAKTLKQPFGNGEYSNQLFLRTTASKSGVEFFSPSGASTKRNTATLPSETARTHTVGDIGSSACGNNESQQQTVRSVMTSLGSSRRSQAIAASAELFRSEMQNRKRQERLREQLYFDERTKTVPKSNIQNPLIDNIVSNSEVFTGNKQLTRSVFSLKSLNLLKAHKIQVNRYGGIGKFPFVFNDYHTKSTNNGFSRQEKGGFFFTK